MENELYRNSARSIKTKWPVLFNMYDESDPEHTFGDSEFFIDTLNEFLEEAETEEEKVEIEKTIKFVSKYERIEIY